MTCRDLIGMPARPIPPLDAYDGVGIYAKRRGRIRTYELMLYASNPAPERLSWVPPTRGFVHTWIHPDLPGVVLSRDLERGWWVLAQEFTTTPDEELLDRVADWVLGSAARLVSEASLPLRIRLPVLAPYVPTDPTPARCRPIAGVPSFWFETHDLGYSISLVDTTTESSCKVWTQATLGGELFTWEGQARRSLYRPDFRRLAGIDQDEVPAIVEHVIDSLTRATDFYGRHLHIDPNPAVKCQDSMLAALRWDHRVGNLSAHVRLRGPAGDCVFWY